MPRGHFGNRRRFYGLMMFYPRDLSCERRVASFTFFFRSGSPLSNFYPCTFEDEHGQQYCCSEQYYQYHKALLFSDFSMASRIIHSTDSSFIKRCGRNVKGYRKNIGRWQKFGARKVMKMGLWLKFTQNSKLAHHLMNTTRVLVEANPYDDYFGVGLGMYDPAIEDESSWKGRNIQGKLLMELKDEFEKLT